MSDCSPLPYSFTPFSWWWSQAEPRHKQCHFIVMSSRPQEGRRLGKEVIKMGELEKEAVKIEDCKRERK